MKQCYRQLVRDMMKEYNKQGIKLRKLMFEDINEYWKRIKEIKGETLHRGDMVALEIDLNQRDFIEVMYYWEEACIKLDMLDNNVSIDIIENFDAKDTIAQNVIEEMDKELESVQNRIKYYSYNKCNKERKCGPLRSGF